MRVRNKVQLAAQLTNGALEPRNRLKPVHWYPTLPGSAVPAYLTVATWAFPLQSSGEVAILHYPGSGTRRDGRDGTVTGRNGTGRDGTVQQAAPCYITLLGP